MGRRSIIEDRIIKAELMGVWKNRGGEWLLFSNIGETLCQKESWYKRKVIRELQALTRRKILVHRNMVNGKKGSWYKPMNPNFVYLFETLALLEEIQDSSEKARYVDSMDLYPGYYWARRYVSLGFPRDDDILPIEDFFYRNFLRRMLEDFRNLLLLRHIILVRKASREQLNYRIFLQDYIESVIARLVHVANGDFMIGSAKDREFYKRFLSQDLSVKITDDEMLEFIKEHVKLFGREKDLTLPKVTAKQKGKLDMDLEKKIEKIIPLKHFGLILTLGKGTAYEIKNGEPHLILGLDR
jgi:hypothetical protein